MIRAELDALSFHLYGINRDDVDYIMETFPIVKRKDVAEYGTYRTKERILEVYDRMAEAGVSQEPPLVDGENFVSELTQRAVTALATPLPELLTARPRLVGDRRGQLRSGVLSACCSVRG